MTKNQVVQKIADDTGLSRLEVTSVLASLEATIGSEIQGTGSFNFSGLFKIEKRKKLARPARQGINPFTGEEQIFPAKPETTFIKIRPLKKLKEFAK